MKRRIAWLMAALLTISSVESATVLSVSAQEMAEADGWMDESEEENTVEENTTEDVFAAESFTAEENGEEVAAEEDGFTSEADGFTSGEAWAGDADRDSIFPSEDSVTHMELEKSYEAQVHEGESVWFLFEPQVSGTYSFSSQGECDTLGVLYDAGEKQLAVNDDGQSDKNFEISYNLEAGMRYYLETGLTDGQEGTYTVSVAQAEEGNTEAPELAGDKADYATVRSVKIIHKSKYYTGLDRVSARDMKLEITYEDGDTSTISADENEDDYENSFRLKLVVPDQNVVLTGSGIGLDGVDFQDGTGIIFQTAGTYKLQLYVNDGAVPITESDIEVSEIPEEIPEIEEGKEFTVSGGIELFRFTPKAGGYYYLSEPSEYKSAEIIDGTDASELEESWLVSGEEYIFRYDGAAGTAMIEKVPDLDRFSWENEPYILEKTVDGYYALEKLEVIAHYSNGKEYELKGELDRFGNYVHSIILDVGSEDIVEAGDYDVILTVNDWNYYSLPLHVYSIKELAQQTVATGKRQSLKKQEHFDEYTIFSYTPEEDGSYRFETYNRTYGMFGYDDEGNDVKIVHAYNTVDETSSSTDRSDYYFTTLSKGHTYYFAMEGGSEDYTTLKVEKCQKTIQSAVLFNNKTYYENMDEVRYQDFYLNITYSDGNTETLKCGNIGENGDYFRVEMEEIGNLGALSGGGITLAGGDYLVKAYLNGSQESIAQTTVQVKFIDNAQVTRVKEGETFHVNGGDNPEFFRFIPSESGDFYITGIPEKCYAIFYWYSGQDYEWMSDDYLVGEEIYLLKYTGSEPADLTIGMHTGQTSAPFELELNKKYENLSIGSEYGYVRFTYVPEKTAVYQLNLDSRDEFGVSLNDAREDGRYYYGENHPYFILKANQKYTFTVRCGGVFNRGDYTFNAMLTELTDRSIAPVEATIIEKESSTAAIGIDSLESVLEKMTVSFRYDETFYSNRNREKIQLGENTDRYGNKYTVSLEEITGTQDVQKEYNLKVTCNNVTAEKKIAVFDSANVTELKEGQKLPVSYGKKDGHTEDLYCYRFTATKDGNYTLNFDSTANLDGIFVEVCRADGNKIVHSDSLAKGYALRAGETYYFKVLYSSFGEGNTNVFLETPKSVMDIEMIQEPYEVYGNHDVLHPSYAGARFKITYSDGTQAEVGFDEVCGISTYAGRYERIYAREYWSGDRKTVTVQFSLGTGSGHKTEKETYKAISLDEVSSFSMGEKQNLDLGSGIHRRMFKVQVEKDSRYTVITNTDKMWSYFLTEDGVFLNSDETGTPLKKGQVYYVVIGGTGSGTAMLTDAACEHTYTWIIDKEATCAEAGKKHEKCSKCGLEKEAVEIPATGAHQYQMVTDKAATCGEAGSQHEECVVCHAQKPSVEIPATRAHQYQMVTDKAATCGEAGSQHEECVVCHAQKPSVEIPATGLHTFTDYTVVKAPSITAAGLKERKCTVCGKTEQETMDKLKATISVAQKKITVATGKSVAAPEVTFANGDKIVSWKSSKKSVATVSKKGKISGKKAGKATITVTLKSKKTAKITVTVKDKIPATSLKADKSVSLKKGKSYQLNVTVKPLNTTDKVTYKSSNTKIVTVSAKGKIKAKKKGKATITIQAGKKKVTCKVTVK